MRVWLVQISEPLPIDGPEVRLWRNGMLARYLIARGHEVVWWSGGFDHFEKRHRIRRSTKVPLWDSGQIYLLASCGYRKNVSLRRILDHFQVAKEFSRLAPQEAEPDIIVASLPSQDLCAAAADYASKRDIPFIVDIQDQWPDVWLTAVPSWVQPIMSAVLTPVFRQTSRACRTASRLVGATSELLRWGLAYAQRTQSPKDRVFFLGYQREKYPTPVLENKRAFWNALLGSSHVLTVCFLGALSRHFVWETVLTAARILEAENLPVRWILCGVGDAYEPLRRQTVDLSSVFLPGWIDGALIHTLIERSHLGLAPYARTENFYGHFPNKIAEYLSGGLPVLSTLIGGLEQLLDRYQCGWTYEPTNPRQLADLVKKIFHQQDQLPKMQEQAKRLFTDYFDAEKIYPAYVEYIEEAVRVHAAKRQAA